MKIYSDWFRVDHKKLQPQQIVKTPDELSWIFDSMETKECFHNCFMLCAQIPNSTFVLGYATSIIPIEHAWLELPCGAQIDPTFEKSNYTGEHYCSLVSISSNNLFEENQQLNENNYAPSHHFLKKSKKYRHLFI